MASTNVGNAYVTVSARFDKSWSSGVLTKANAVGDLISKGISKAMGAVSSSIDSAISRVDTMNNFPRIMENMGVSSEAANRAIKTLSKGIDGLPTALDTAVLGVERFTSKNGDVDKSADYFLALNDAILAGGASSEIQASAVEQLSQSYAKGKMDMMEWRSLQQAMPAQINQIAKAMGKSADELGEGLRDGSISMDEFMEKIVELDKEGGEGFASFAEQAKSATGGIGTALTNVQNRVSKAVGSIIDSIGAENIAGAINAFSSRIADFAKPVIAFVDAFKGNFNFSAFMSELGPFGQILESIGGKVMELAGNLGQLFGNVMTVGAPAFKLIGGVISSVFMAALNVVNAVAEGLNALFGEFDMMEMGWEKQSSAIAATGEELEGYVSVIDELTSKESLNAVEQEKLKQAVEGYNRITGDSISITDAAKGELSKSTDEIRANAEAWKDNAYAQLYQQEISDILADSEMKRQRLIAANKQLIETEQKYQDVLNNPDKYSPELYAEASLAVANATANVQALSGSIEENDGKLAEAEERLGAVDKSLLAYIESNVSLKQKLDESGVSSTKFANYLNSIGKSEKDLANMSPEVVDSLIGIAKASDRAGGMVGSSFQGMATGAAVAASKVIAGFSPVPTKLENAFATAQSGAAKNLNGIETKSRASANNSSAAFNSLPALVNAKFNEARARSSGQLDSIASRARTASSQSGSAFNSFPGAVGSKMADAVARARGSLNGVVSAADSAQSQARSKFDGLGGRISNAIGSIHFPVPHISYWSVDVLGVSARIPHIEWYAKGGFVDGATLIGAGEKGREMILPESGGLMDSFSENVARQVSNDDVIAWLGSNLGPIIAAFAPTATPRDIRRMNQKVAAYA